MTDEPGAPGDANVAAVQVDVVAGRSVVAYFMVVLAEFNREAVVTLFAGAVAETAKHVLNWAEKNMRVLSRDGDRLMDTQT